MVNYCKVSKENLKYPIPEFVLSNKVFIAGGAIRDSLINLKYSDIDVFGTNRKDLDKFITENLSDYRIVFDAPNMKTYKKGDIKVQVILREFSSIEDCLNYFDFTICQFAYNGTEIICNPESLIHLNNKRLVINNLDGQFLADTLRRMQKYIQKGYLACSGTIKTILEKAITLKKEDLEAQLEFYPNGSKRKIIRFD
jgi:hypothetical protein